MGYSREFNSQKCQKRKKFPVSNQRALTYLNAKFTYVQGDAYSRTSASLFRSYPFNDPAFQRQTLRYVLVTPHAYLAGVN